MVAFIFYACFNALALVLSWKGAHNNFFLPSLWLETQICHSLN